MRHCRKTQRCLQDSHLAATAVETRRTIPDGVDMICSALAAQQGSARVLLVVEWGAVATPMGPRLFNAPQALQSDGGAAATGIFVEAGRPGSPEQVIKTRLRALVAATFSRDAVALFSSDP